MTIFGNYTPEEMQAAVSMAMFIGGMGGMVIGGIIGYLLGRHK
jgi:hypothetical protein